MTNVRKRVTALLLCVFVLTAGTPFFVFAEQAGQNTAEQDAAPSPEKATATDPEEPAWTQQDNFLIRVPER